MIINDDDDDDDGDDDDDNHHNIGSSGVGGNLSDKGDGDTNNCCNSSAMYQ